MKMNLYNLPHEFMSSENEALGFCVTHFLNYIKNVEKEFEELFCGEGFCSDDGFELCRWKRRYLGKDVNAEYIGDGFLAWTDPEDFGFSPNWKIYEESEFKKIFYGCCMQCFKSVGGAIKHEKEIRKALKVYGCGEG